MADRLSKEQRHRCMSHVKGKDTSIELAVRKHLFSLGFRYRLNSKTLPGHPDIVLPKYHAVIFVNGCFWHGHQGCKNATIPRTNASFWKDKIETNKDRDSRNQERLLEMGWKVVTIWECELKKSVFNETMNKVIRMIREE